MAKSDELRRSMGGTMAETVMHRPPPAAMPSVGGQGLMSHSGPRDRRGVRRPSRSP